MKDVYYMAENMAEMGGNTRARYRISSFKSSSAGNFSIRVYNSFQAIYCTVHCCVSSINFDNDSFIVRLH